MSDSQFEFEFTIGSYTGEELNVELPDRSWATYGADRAACSSAACPHPTAHPAEVDWQQLASAVPVPGQLYRLKPRCEGMAYPTEDDFRSVVRAVRPEAADDFSMRRIREGWTDEVAGRVGEWPERVRSRLSALAENWAGEDFDAFAAQIDQTRTLIEGVLDDIEAAADGLQHLEEVVYTLQGGDSGEIPYPAPLVGVEGEWSNLVSIHVRPAWWRGDCIRMSCEEAEEAMRLAGADPSLATEVREFIDEKVGERLSGLGALVSPVRQLAGQDAKEQYGSRVAAELAAYLERQAAIDEGIAQKRTDQSAELRTLEMTGDERPAPSSADGADMDLASLEMERPVAPAPPETTQHPSMEPPSGDGSTVSDESGEVSGGLASGGLSGGTGGGFGGTTTGGTGGFSTASTTTGLFTGSTSSTSLSTAAGAGGGIGGAAGGAGGAAGARVGAMGAAPGAAFARGAAEDTKRSRDDDEDDESEEEDGDGRLLNRETGNVWGFVHRKDDPYA